MKEFENQVKETLKARFEPAGFCLDDRLHEKAGFFKKTGAGQYIHVVFKPLDALAGHFGVDLQLSKVPAFPARLLETENLLPVPALIEPSERSGFGIAGDDPDASGWPAEPEEQLRENLARAADAVDAAFPRFLTDERISAVAAEEIPNLMSIDLKRCEEWKKFKDSGQTLEEKFGKLRDYKKLFDFLPKRVPGIAAGNEAEREFYIFYGFLEYEKTKKMPRAHVVARAGWLIHYHDLKFS